jgi:hypothetical protein
MNKKDQSPSELDNDNMLLEYELRGDRVRGKFAQAIHRTTPLAITAPFKQKSLNTV